MRLPFLILACSFSLGAFSQSDSSAHVVEMKQYWFVMLVKGKDRDKITDTAVLNKLQAGHMANINRLAQMGKLVVAGPFGDDGNWRGILIFDCESKEAVQEYLRADPSITAGRMDYEIHPWWTAKGATFK